MRILYCAAVVTFFFSRLSFFLAYKNVSGRKLDDCLSQTVTQLKAILTLLAGWRYASQCLCVQCTVTVHRRIPILHGPECNFREWYVVPCCALLGGFAIGARVSMLWQHIAPNAKWHQVLVYTRSMPAFIKFLFPYLCSVFHPVFYTAVYPVMHLRCTLAQIFVESRMWFDDVCQPALYMAVNEEENGNLTAGNAPCNELECGPMPNVMAALPNTGGALCSTPQSLADAHY